MFVSEFTDFNQLFYPLQPQTDATEDKLGSSTRVCLSFSPSHLWQNRITAYLLILAHAKQILGNTEKQSLSLLADSYGTKKKMNKHPSL